MERVKADGMAVRFVSRFVHEERQRARARAREREREREMRKRQRGRDIQREFITNHTS